MATITKTFTENIGNTPYSTWTLTASGINAVASEPTFEFTAPVVTAKFVNSQRKFALVRINDLLTLADGTIIIGFTHDRGGGVEDPMPTNSGTQYTLSPDPDKRTPITSRIFNTNNPRERVVNVHFKQRTVTLETRTTETTGVSRYYSSEQIDWGVVATITLDAPPTYTLSALSKDTSDYYANLTTVSVTISSATAQYGGDISISSLTIGSQTVTGSGNGTLSMRLNNAGTFTPTVIVTDSRGQSTTKTLETITVQPYLVPSVTFDVYRTNDTGIKNDEGHYGLIVANITYTDAVATITEPSVTIDGTATSNITWYSGYSSSTGVSSAISNWSSLTPTNHSVTVYGLMNGSFNTEQSYVIGMSDMDSLGGSSQTVLQTLSTAFYTIDFQAGGKEIAFGAPANDTLTQEQEQVGLFKCAMEASFENDVLAESPHYHIDTSAASGTTDGDLYRAINGLGWSSIISSGKFAVKNLLTKILKRLDYTNVFTVSYHESETITTGAYTNRETSQTCTKSGYYPLGIVGYYPVWVSGQTALINFYLMELSSRSSGSATVYYGLQNTGGSSVSYKLRWYILWIKE